MKRPHNSLTLKIFFLILMTDILESIAELFFKKGAAATGIKNVGLHNFLYFTSKIVSAPSLWLGFLFYSLNFLFWMVVLSRIDLSVASPVGSATYIIVPILAVLFLREKVTLLRWAGVFLILIGIFFISHSTRIKTKNQ